MKWRGVGSIDIGMFRNFLDECFTYDALSGELNWKVRPVHHFQSEATHKRWVTRCYGKCVGHVKMGRYTSYRRVKLLGSTIEAHIICWILHTGTYPEGDIDHLDGNGLNNRADNLRDRDNFKNRRLQKSNRSGIVGVHWNEAKCRFIVTGDANSKHLGTFLSLFEAVCVRKSWELENGYTPDYGGLSGIEQK